MSRNPVLPYYNRNPCAIHVDLINSGRTVQKLFFDLHGLNDQLDCLVSTMMDYYQSWFPASGLLSVRISTHGFLVPGIGSGRKFHILMNPELEAVPDEVSVPLIVFSRLKMFFFNMRKYGVPVDYDKTGEIDCMGKIRQKNSISELVKEYTPYPTTDSIGLSVIDKATKDFVRLSSRGSSMDEMEAAPLQQGITESLNFIRATESTGPTNSRPLADKEDIRQVAPEVIMEANNSMNLEALSKMRKLYDLSIAVSDKDVMWLADPNNQFVSRRFGSDVLPQINPVFLAKWMELSRKPLLYLLCKWFKDILAFPNLPDMFDSFGEGEFINFSSLDLPQKRLICRLYYFAKHAAGEWSFEKCALCYDKDEVIPKLHKTRNCPFYPSREARLVRCKELGIHACCYQRICYGWHKMCGVCLENSHISDACPFAAAWYYITHELNGHIYLMWATKNWTTNDLEVVIPVKEQH